MITRTIGIFSLFLYTNASGIYHQEVFDVITPTEQEYDMFACTKDPMTFIIEIKIHAQRPIVEAIQAVMNTYDGYMDYDVIAAAESYFGEIFDELNMMLLKYKVQLHMNLDALVIEDFMTDLTFDRSCELRDPVAERTVASIDLLRKKYNNSIGLNLFLWSCPRDPVEHPIYHIETNEFCGRVMGLLWQGTNENRESVKEIIMKSLTDPQRTDNSLNDLGIVPEGMICAYVNKCLARNLTDLGQKVIGTAYLGYKDNFLYDQL